jgi:hypothetical protein
MKLWRSRLVNNVTHFQGLWRLYCVARNVEILKALYRTNLVDEYHFGGRR